MNRRSFIHATIVSGIAPSIPPRVWAQENTNKLKTAKVPSGQDRLNEPHNIGVSDTTFKVLTDETEGNLFVMEQSNHKKGGPPKHLHYGEEEYFYVIEGNYVVEVGTERFELAPGTPYSRHARFRMHGHSLATAKGAFSSLSRQPIRWRRGSGL
jgi:mannose-6-phosphate isomerase-like protein (cupin superfamily)